MKSTLLILSVFLSLSGLAQNSKHSLLIISPTSIGNEDVNVAFRISGRQIEIDNKYNRETNVFTRVKIIPLKDERILEALYKKSTQELINYQKEIEATNCDYSPPVTLVVSKGKTESTIEWRMIINCFPASNRKIAASLPDIFLKYKN